MDDRFFHGLLGCEVSVCGQRLRNLTPWHLVLLNMIGSPIIQEGKQAGRHDILIFRRVVGTQWPDQPEIKPRLRDIYWMWRLRKKRVFLKHIIRLRGWMEIQTSTPKLWTTTYSEGSTQRTLSSPAMLALVMGLVSKAGMPLADCWNMRLAEARWCDVALAEINGSPLRVAYEGEQQPAAKLKPLTEDEIIAITKTELPPEQFKTWLAARRETAKK